jgi:hypothetical protein
MNKSPQLIGDQVPLITSANNDQQPQHVTKGLHGWIIMRQLKSINLMIHLLFCYVFIVWSYDFWKCCKKNKVAKVYGWEIVIVKKNNTRKLTKLLKGWKTIGINRCQDNVKWKFFIVKLGV